MNIFDILNNREKEVLSLMLKGLPISKVADIYNLTIDDVNNVRSIIITKLEKISSAEINENRRFQLFPDN